MGGNSGYRNGVLHIPLGYEWLLKVNKNLHTKAENFFLAHKRALECQSTRKPM